MNDVLATCTAADPADCSFTYLPAQASPTITAIVSPTPLLPGSLIQIQGSGLASGSGMPAATRYSY